LEYKKHNKFLKIGLFAGLVTLIFIVLIAAIMPRFRISNLTANSSEIEAGQPIEIFLTVSNDGYFRGACTVFMKIDEKIEMSKEVTLGGGQSETVSFNLVKYVAGTYTLEIDGYSQILTVNPREKTTPEIPSYQPHTFELKPAATATHGTGYSFTIETSRTEFYDFSRGYVKIWFINRDNNDLFVYKYGSQPEWMPRDVWFSSDTGITIRSNERKYIGMTSIKVDSDIDSFSVKYGFSLMAKTAEKWYDYGTVFMDPKTIQVNPVIEETHQEYVTNEFISKKANDLVDSTDPTVREVALEIAGRYPGDYNVYQLCALFDYVSENIRYVSEPPGTDYWAKPSETLALSAGDCEDQAILLVSLIEAIGGTTRLYTTENHMFAAVYIGTENFTNSIVDAIENYYNTPLTLHYLIDGDDVWLLLEPTGGFYAGSLPVGAKPTETSWSFENVRIITVVDVTR